MSIIAKKESSLITAETEAGMWTGKQKSNKKMDVQRPKTSENLY